MKKTYSHTATALMACLIAMIAATAKADTKTWTLSSFSSDDLALMAADETNWAAHSDGNRYCLQTALADEQLTAGGTVLSTSEGLYFTCGEGSGDGGKIRVNYGSSRFEMNGSNIVVRIPSLTAGQTVTVSCKTASSSSERTFSYTNLTAADGSFEASTDKQINIGTVTADGDVTLTTSDGGMYVYYITVSDASDDDGEEGNGDGSIDLSGYNYTSRSTEANQVKLLLTSNDLLYYNTEDVSINISDSIVNIVANDNSYTDVFTATVERISFNEAVETGTEGQYDNGDGEITIVEAKGWFESVYIEWTAYDGASSYNVYVKGGSISEYTQIDGMLVREYADCCRADMVGLVAGNDYCLRIVAVDDEGNEIETSANEATGMVVTSYNRDGFAHFGYSGIGAYNDDGSLKDGARVLYVTAETAKTITCDVQTSSSKTTTCTGMQAIIDAYQKGYDTTPIDFRIVGCITEDDMDDLSSSSEGLQIKGKNSYSEMNMTIEGIGEDATIHGFGILIRNSMSVELRNFAVMDFMDDGVSLDTDNSNIWVHNLDIFYGQTGSASDQAKGDGSIDVKSDSKYITIYNCRFWDSGKCSLCGMTYDDGPDYITYHHNWFDHADSRMPRIRAMSVHVYNNYYDGIGKYGIGSTNGSSVFADRNYFRATGRPMMISGQGTDATGDGTFSGEEGGIIKAYGNVFTEKPSAFSYITFDDSNTSFDAYEVNDPGEEVPSDVVSLDGNNTYDNFDTSSSLMYSYDADDAADVPDIVTGYYGAGRLNHGDFEYDITGDYGSYDVDETLKSMIENYTSSLVSIFGSESTGSATGSTTPTDSTTATDSGAAVIYFTDTDGTVSDSRVTATGSGSDSKGTITYNGTEYTNCLKLSSSASVTLNSDDDYTMTMYFTSTKASSVYVNGEGQDLTDTGTDAGDGYTVYTYTQAVSSGEYVITKKSTESNLFIIVLE